MKLDRSRKATFLIIVALLIIGVLIFFHFSISPLIVSNQSTDISSNIGFISDQKCAQCHQSEYQQWTNSHHALAMQVADSKTVLGDFNNKSYTYFGITTRFFSREGKYYINTEGSDGKVKDYEVKYTFGMDPLQQYLVEFPGGRLQAFSIAWDVKNKKWFHLSPHENITSDDPLFWTKRFYNWNNSCAECHSTNIRKNYDAKTDMYHTTWSEINVGCQACHGPGATHVMWAKEKIGTDPILFYNKQNPERILDSCAPCHSRRTMVNPDPKVGDLFLNNYLPQILLENIYYPDGGIQEEDFEYGSFVQSKMYQNGVSCTDCHNPHSAKLVLEGNAVCTQCHNPNPPRTRFPNLIPKNYDSPSHYFHMMNSPGAQCVSCHMPTKTYMVIDVRHDHYFRIPRPDLTIQLGVPNACNECHKDRSAEWAQANIEKWYGKKSYPNDYAQTIALGRENESQADSSLVQLADNGEQTAIVRATVLYLLKQSDSKQSIESMVRSLNDKSALIRSTAVSGLDELPFKERIQYAAPLLDDPIRAVRFKAAWILAPVPKEMFTPAQYQAFNKALTEYKESQKAQLDQPEANFNLGEIYRAQGNLPLAIQYYKNTLKLDPDFYPAATVLAILYSQTGDWKTASIYSDQLLKMNPQSVYYQQLHALIEAHLGAMEL